MWKHSVMKTKALKRTLNPQNQSTGGEGKVESIVGEIFRSTFLKIRISGRITYSIRSNNG